MQPAAAVVAGIDNKGVAVAVFSKGLGIDLPKAGGVHASDMDISDPSAGEFLNPLFIAPYPAKVIPFGIAACRGDDDVFLLS